MKLKRELGIPGAIPVGLGSILGTGVFVSIALAADVAGPSVILAVIIAAAVAVCNAMSSAQLAASHPVSGGTYEYGYKYLTPMLGFSAGWLFLCAKSASAATAALGCAGYLLHFVSGAGNVAVPLAVGIALAMTVVVSKGLKRTNIANAAIVSVTLLALISYILLGIGRTVENQMVHMRPLLDLSRPGALHGLLEASALMFVAFTGYGRIATLGEEIREPRKYIPKAIAWTVGISALLYVGVATAGIGAVGAEKLEGAVGGTLAPLASSAEEFAGSAMMRIISVGAITAMLGVLLNLIIGLSRVLLAMSRRGDFPALFSKLNAEQTAPTRAVILVGGIIGALCLIGSIKVAWSFSAFTVLIYYSITNIAALKLSGDDRLYSRAFSWFGLIGCLGLAFWVDPRIWLTGLGVLGIGLVFHLFRRKNVLLG